MEDQKAAYCCTVNLWGWIYMALAATVQECLYLEQLLQNIDGLKYESKVYEDNQGAIASAKNPVYRQRCKAHDIKYHFVRSVINEGRISLEYCPTDIRVADVLRSQHETQVN